MNAPPLKLAVIAGEVSGDLLGGDLVAAIRRQFKGNVDLVGVGGDEPHPDIAASGGLMDFEHVGDLTQCGDDRIQVAVVHFQGHEGQDVIAELAQIDVAAAITQDFGTLQPAQARLRCVARNTDLICEFRDLDAGILDQREQHFQVYII